jgi:tRNA modification GTPase
MPDQATIFALSTPPGRSAVAVIRISGPAASLVLETIAQPCPMPRSAAFRRLRAPRTGELIDEALVLWFPGPGSETGEDTAELQVHGGRAVIAAVCDALAGLPGLRMAEPGEFARRAFENGKIDLTRAEGIADLVDAETEGQRRQAVRQAGGALARLYEGWRGRLLEASALVESAIDFSDEADVSGQAYQDARELMARLLPEIEAHLDDGRRGEILREGFRVVIAGPPNVGKSSLLNALAKREAAIVSEEAGTTRDVIEVTLDLGGLPVILSDTAGMRETQGKVEREGIRRAVAQAKGADLVLWLADASLPQASLPAELENLEVLSIATRIDLLPDGQQASPEAVGLSTITGAGVADVLKAIEGQVRRRLHADERPVITQARHRQHLDACRVALAEFLAGDVGVLELRAEDLRRAVAALGRITGRVDAEDVLGQIFSRFCIGK